MGFNLSTFLQWRINIYAYQKLGWRFTYYYVKILAWLYYAINFRKKSKIRTVIETVFGERTKRSELNALVKEVMHGIVAHYYEKLFNAYSAVETLKAFVGSHIEGQGLETIQNELGHNKGLLLITGHVGGVELIPAFLGYHRFPVTIIAKFSSCHLLEASLIQARCFKTRIIDAERTPNVLRELIANLNENRIVITQCDEIDEWRPSRHEQIHFLGKTIRLDRTLNVLVRRLDAPIVVGLMHRRQNHHYRFTVASRAEIEKNVTATTPMSIGAMVLKHLERYIYNNPAGWYQWKKYPSIVPIASSVDAATRRPETVLLDTAVGEAALR